MWTWGVRNEIWKLGHSNGGDGSPTSSALTVSTDGVADPPFTVELLEGLDECTVDTETPDGLVTQALYALLVEAGAGQEGGVVWTIESWLNSAGGEERPEDAVRRFRHDRRERQ